MACYDNLKRLKTISNTAGKLIVIDGADGSGKATQTELLAQRLKQAGLAVELADYTIINDGTQNELYKKLIKLLASSKY